MRTIKFRGKDAKTGEWRYGFYAVLHIPETNNHAELLGYKEVPSIFNDEQGERGKGGCWHEVRHDTVGQFTGLTDKDGKEIYEGDIVECVSWNEYFSNPEAGEVMQPFRRKMYVDFRKGGYKMVEPMPYPMKDNEWDIIYNGDVKIIGNTHDNPELLEKKEG